jgi:hypothetical protein
MSRLSRITAFPKHAMPVARQRAEASGVAHSRKQEQMLERVTGSQIHDVKERSRHRSETAYFAIIAMKRQE